MTRPRGFTLIELMATMAASAAVIAVAIGVLQMLIQLEGDARDRAGQRAALARLADQFRGDVHSAERLVAPSAEAGHADAGRAWRLALNGDAAVEYLAADGALVRTVLTGDKPGQRERFNLPEDAVVEIATETVAGATIASLRIAGPPPDRDAHAPRFLYVEARQGLDRRFAPDAETKP